MKKTFVGQKNATAWKRNPNTTNKASKEKDILGQLGELMIFTGTAHISPKVEQRIDAVISKAAEEIRRLRELLRNKPSIPKEEEYL
jgi:hypothetical protein